MEIKPTKIVLGARIWTKRAKSRPKIRFSPVSPCLTSSRVEISKNNLRPKLRPNRHKSGLKWRFPAFSFLFYQMRKNLIRNLFYSNVVVRASNLSSYDIAISPLHFSLKAAHLFQKHISTVLSVFEILFPFPGPLF